MRKHITSISLLLESVCPGWLFIYPISLQSRDHDPAWVNERNKQIFPIISLISDVVRDGSLDQTVLKWAAISSSSAAQLIYILGIYMQMKTACLLLEIGMQTHIMLPHHFVFLYNSSLFKVDSCTIWSTQLSCWAHNRCVLKKKVFSVSDCQDIHKAYFLPTSPPLLLLLQYQVYGLHISTGDLSFLQVIIYGMIM